MILFEKTGLVRMEMVPSSISEVLMLTWKYLLAVGLVETAAMTGAVRVLRRVQGVSEISRFLKRSHPPPQKVKKKKINKEREKSRNLKV